jgi:hypothetical protein
VSDDTDLDLLDSSIESAARRVMAPGREPAFEAAVRGRRRRTVRRAGGLVTALVVIAGVTIPLALLWPLGGESEPRPPAASESASSTPASPTTTKPSASPSPSPSASPSVIEARGAPLPPFVPPTYREGDRVVMPVTFPDGSTAEVVYPADLDLAGQGVHPKSSGYLQGKGTGYAIDFWIARGTVEEAIAALGGGELEAEYPDGRGGNVSLWNMTKRFEPNWQNWLGFQLGSWAVMVHHAPPGAGPAPMTEEERATWARTLRGDETADGFLVLEAEPPLELARPGDKDGPELGIGDEYKLPFVLLVVGRCEQYRAGEGGFQEGDLVRVGDVVMDRSSDFASWCDPGGLMRVHVYQARGDDYIDRIALDVEIRSVRLAS